LVLRIEWGYFRMLLLLFFISPPLLNQGLAAVMSSLTSNQLRYDVNGNGEDDGAVFLRRDVIEGLQVTKLHDRRETDEACTLTIRVAGLATLRRLALPLL